MTTDHADLRPSRALNSLGSERNPAPQVRAVMRSSQRRLLMDSSGDYSIQPGDLVFGRRSSWPERLLALAGDFLSHCGVVFESDGELRVAEFGPVGAFSRPLAEFANAYEVFGHSRPAVDSECRARLAAAGPALIDENRWFYCWPSGVVLDTGLVVRRYLPGAVDGFVIRSTIGAAKKIRQQHGDQALTCSGFVFECLGRMCSRCRPTISWPTRPRVSGWKTSPSLTDVPPVTSDPDDLESSIVRILVSPFDLWVSVPAEFKVVVAAGLVTVLHDHIDPPLAIPMAEAA